MSSLPALTAQTDSTTSKNALVAADNAKFITDADNQILAAIALGKYQISMTTFGRVNAREIAQYYGNLGYWIAFPDLMQGPNFQPADLFGSFWTAFWNNTLFPFFGKKPVRIVIGWSAYNPYANNVQNES